MHGAQTCTCVQSYVQGFCTCNGREVRTGGNLPGNFFSKVMTGRSALVALTASWQMFCMHLIIQSKLVRHQPRSGSRYPPMQVRASTNLSVDASVALRCAQAVLAVGDMILTVGAIAPWNVPLPAPPHWSTYRVRNKSQKLSKASHPASDNKRQSRDPRCPGVMSVA